MQTLEIAETEITRENRRDSDIDIHSPSRGEQYNVNCKQIQVTVTLAPIVYDWG